jgi:23S rRNA pseudouridine1911/1915/1917 synthase
MSKRIKILYEDSNILAIDKPSGILSHPDKTSKQKTVLDWAVKKFSNAELVHRLDKETSGIMVIAKNKKAHEFLKKQFVDRKVKKTYVAIVDGWVKNDHGVINKPIGRSPSDFRRRLSGRGARGEMREAITEYKVLKRFEVEAERGQIYYARGSRPVRGEGRSAKKFVYAPLEKFTYLEIHPKTGRTHQIRVHMKFLNHPVACDSLYNSGQPCPKGISRLALHAKSIEFKNLKGETIKVESPLPIEFKKAIK